MKAKMLMLGAFLLLVALALVSCQSTPVAQETQAPAPTPQPCPTAAPCPECPACPEPVVQDVPFQEAWAASPHADATSEAFIHWDEENPAEVPPDCAKCHSTPGYLDFLGEDGSEPNVVNNPAPIGTVVDCVACHNAAAATKTSVVFPSGIEVVGLDASARCMECHQGRASKVQVDARIEELGLTDQPDTASEELGFINIHYYAAAATLYGTVTQGGYEYEGQQYEARFDHVAGYNSCIGCHNAHTTELKIDECAACHTGVASAEDLRNVRTAGSLHDYDGDGDLTEGVAFELAGLQEKALAAIQAYAAEVNNAPIVYDSSAYPYFFNDSDGDGQVTEGEAAFPNAYKSWTPRLLKAAYNYQTTLKDPGAYAHNGKYMIQLLHDSIQDLNSEISTPVDMEAAARLDAGHFAGSEEAFRHWDHDEETGGMVPANCTKCHTAEGLPFFLANGVTISMAPSTGLNCATCHDDVSTFTRFMVEEVKMPSGAVVAFDNADANLCLQCHQGRESKVSVDAAIQRAGVGDDEVSEALSFRNPHYFAAGATVFGTEAMGAYEFDGQDYNGRFVHVPAFDTCVECHDSHNLEVRADQCTACHGSPDLTTYRAPAGDTTDYDGDGDVTEGYAGEIAGMHETLYAAIQAYTADVIGTPIVYNASAYPYFFIDTNGDGVTDADEANFGNRYVTWTPTLLRSAYNYTWVAKDPGAFAHNGQYIMQILYDSISAIGGDVSGMTRPAVEAAPAE